MSQVGTSPKRFELSNQEIDAAFRQNMFKLVYQPQIATSGGVTFGAEAFARWHHPEYGNIPPAVFANFIESQGRSRELTNYVLRNAIETAAKWHRSGIDWSITANVNLTDLADGTLPISIDILVRDLDFDLSRLVIDVPESELTREWDRKWSNVSTTIKAIKDHGVMVTLDGSGPHLLDTDRIDPELFDGLKISGSASLQYANQTNNLGFGHVSQRLDFAKKHDLKTFAVGAEDHATLLALKNFGFDYVQGHVISKPLTMGRLSEWRRDYMAPTAFSDGSIVSTQTEEIEEVDLSKTPMEDEPAEITAEWSVSASETAGEDEAVLKPKRS